MARNTIVRDMMRRGPKFAVAVSVGRKPGGMMEGPSHGESGVHPDHPSPMGDGQDHQAQIHQEAYDKVTEGLSVLAEDYPEAGRILKQFDSLWAKWQGGHAADIMGSDAGGPPLSGTQDGAYEPGAGAMMNEGGPEGGAS